MLDDLSLQIKTDAGLVILLGCAHCCSINIIRHFQHRTGDERVYAIIGGMHLMRSPAGRLSETVRALKSVGVRKLFYGSSGERVRGRLQAQEGGARITLP